jgi:aryl-alcohol dehydrogenase-like predicted oxidoreductase
LAELKGWVPLTAVNYEYSLSERSVEREILPVAKALGLGVSAWSILDGGYLTGQSADTSEFGQPSVHDATVLAAEVGVPTAHVAYAWLFTRVAASTTTIIPVIGADTVEQFDALLASRDLDLTDAQLSALNEVSAPALGEPRTTTDSPNRSSNDPGASNGYRRLTPVA